MGNEETFTQRARRPKKSAAQLEFWARRDLAKIIIIISLTILTRHEGRLPNGWRNTTTWHGIGRRKMGMEWKRFTSTMEELGGLSYLFYGPFVLANSCERIQQYLPTSSESYQHETLRKQTNHFLLPIALLSHVPLEIHSTRRPLFNPPTSTIIPRP